jgi:phytoene desaturase
MKINIIGAGLAGLSCGVHLARQGHQVHIWEKNNRIGGRANRVDEAGFKIDMGPTLVLMPEVLEGLFRSAGRSLPDYINLKRLEPGYRILFSDGKHFDMSSDPQAIRAEITKFVPDGLKAFERYVGDVREKFEASRYTFIEKNFNHWAEMVNLESAAAFLRIKPWGNAYDHVAGYFKEPHVAAALSCQNLYLGQSPWLTPALYNLLAYLEFTYGVWYPMGGLHTVPEALAKLFKELGGEITLGAEVEGIQMEKGRAVGIRLKSGELHRSDAVVSNRDLPSSFQKFVPAAARPDVTDQKIDQWHYGCSTFMLYLGMKSRVNGLNHHNIILPQEYKQATDQIFVEGRLPDKPLLYVCCPTKTDASLAPEGGEAIYVLCIVPNLNGKVDWAAELPGFRKKILDQFLANGIEIREDQIALERHFAPQDFKDLYGSQNGTAFGLAPDFFQSAAFRPAIKSRDVKGLYHVGASTHPGGGIPMVLTCGRLAAEQIQKDAARGAVRA